MYGTTRSGEVYIVNTTIYSSTGLLGAETADSGDAGLPGGKRRASRWPCLFFSLGSFLGFGLSGLLLGCFVLPHETLVCLGG